MSGTLAEFGAPLPGRSREPSNRSWWAQVELVGLRSKKALNGIKGEVVRGRKGDEWFSVRLRALPQVVYPANDAYSRFCHSCNAHIIYVHKPHTHPLCDLMALLFDSLKESPYFFFSCVY